MEQKDKVNQNIEDAESKPHRHSRIITGFRTLDESIHWRFTTRNLPPHQDESIEVRFFILIRDTPAPQKGDAIRTLLKQMESINVSWFVPDRTEWSFDLDRMREEFKDLQELDWCRGRVHLEPEFEVKKEDIDISNHKYFETAIVFYINPKVLGITPMRIPPEIQQSLRDFRLDYPDSKKAGSHGTAN